MNPGAFDCKVGFERNAPNAENALGEPVERWRLLGRAWAKRADARDSEAVAVAQEMSVRLARFTVRADALSRDLTAADRLVLGGAWDEAGTLVSGEVWNVAGVKPVGGGRAAHIEITAMRRSDVPA